MGFKQVNGVWLAVMCIGLPMNLPFNTLVICGWEQLVYMEPRPPTQSMVWFGWIDHMEPCKCYNRSHSKDKLYAPNGMLLHPSETSHFYGSVGDSIKRDFNYLECASQDEIQGCTSIN